MGQRYAVIMAGGKGERFWPASRLKKPKHLLPIIGNSPMLTQTVDRLRGFLHLENIIIITNQEQVEGVKLVCPDVPDNNIVAEPVGRDTAAAVGLAMLLVKDRDPEAALAMLPADHYIENSEAFCGTLDIAFRAAEASPSLVTIGITPTEPATGFGYIQRGSAAMEIEGTDVCRVAQFKEKPDAATAQSYLDSGDYFWNAGMFVWSVSAISEALAAHTPSLYAGLEEIDKGLAGGKELVDLLSALYPSLEKISIDFAVMEKASNVLTVASAFDWDDVGAWPAIERHFPADEKGNIGKGSSAFHDSAGNIVVSDDAHLVALVGVEDLVVVRTEDATLVCRKDQVAEIKGLVKCLDAAGEYRHLL